MRLRKFALLIIVLALVQILPILSMAAPADFDFVSLRYDDPTAIYMFEDGQTITPSMKVTLKNNKMSALSGEMTASFALHTTADAVMWSADGSKTTFTIAAGQESAIDLMGVSITQAGYYVVTIKVSEGGSIQSKDYGLSVVRKPKEGMRKDSMFGLALSLGPSLDVDMTIEIARRTGMKWHRGGLDPRVAKPTKDGPYWGKEEQDKVINQIKKLNDNGISMVGLVDYNMTWNVLQDSPLGVVFRTHQNRPIDLQAQADMVYEMLKPLVGYLEYCEIWNEPWIHGWTWKTGSAQDYREMARLIYEKVRSDPALDSIMLLGGGSTGYSRDVLYPMDAKGNFTQTFVDGSINHPYGHVNLNSNVAIEVQKRLDQKGSVTGGKGGLWFTEFAAAPTHLQHVHEDERVYEAGRNVAPLYLSMLQATCDTDVPAHGFWFQLVDTTSERDTDGQIHDFEYNIFNPRTQTPRPAVSSYAAMTHFMEDRRLSDNWDLFPNSKNIMGYLMQDNANGKTNAMIYTDKDKDGKIILKNARGLKAYNYMGTRLFDGDADTFEADLRYWETLYIESDLQADELRRIIEGSDIIFDKPLLVYPLSFTKPISGVSSIDIMVENASAAVQNGTIELTKIPAGFVMNADKIEVNNLMPGEKRVLNFSIRHAQEDALNRYDVEFKAAFGASVWLRTQTIQSAYAPKKSIAIDGNLNDWSDITGVSMISNGTVNAQELSLNPELARQVAQGGISIDDSLAVYKMKTAWDDDYFYMSAEISDETPDFRDSFDIDDYVFPFQSDSIQIGINCGIVNKDNIFIDKIGTPGYDKYYGDDLNYEFSFRRAALSDGKYGSEMERLTADGTNYQTYYPGNPDLNPKMGTLDAYERGGKDGKIITWHDARAKMWYCEAALSWENIPELKKQIDGTGDNNAMTCKLTWAVNDTGLSSRGTSYWTRETSMLQPGAQGLAPHWGLGGIQNGGRIMTPWGFGSILPQNIKILLDGRRLALDVSPIIENDRTLVPVRAALEALGATLDYDEVTRTVTGVKGGTSFKLTLDSTDALVNGEKKVLDVPAKIINDRTMVPIRFVAENFGAIVGWDQENQAVLIEY